MSFTQGQTSKPNRFMQQLDLWSAEYVVGELIKAYDELHATNDHERWAKAVATVQRSIREKVLESYRNGQGAPSKGGRK